MDKIEEWHEELSTYLYDGEDTGTITEFEENYKLPIGKEDINKAEKYQLPESLISLLKMFNGFELKWFSDPENGIGGNMHFLELKYILQNWKCNLYEEADVIQNDLIQYYKPFDLITEIFSCGLLITPDYINSSIYCHVAPEPQLYNLDINFDGYLEMVKEARAFYYWPKVLLDIQSGDECEETKNFKKNMPLIFEDFSWDEFVEKYQALRLSTKG
jgi:hypothetical protein